MHIPSADTTEIEVLTFEEALASSIASDEYDVEKWLYAPNFYSEYRYILGTRGKNPLICVGINPSTAKPDALDNTLKSVQRIADGNGFDSFLMFNVYAPNFYSEYRYILGTRGKNPLICVGINPSTAKPDALDNTLKSVQRIADGNGFDSFLMFNVYAQRATRPDDMEKSCNLRLHEENMKAFRHLLSIGEKPAVWAAWGAIIEKRRYLPECVADMLAISREYDAQWFCAGPISKKGHPHHPLYLRKDEKLKPFDTEAYLKQL